MLIGVTPAGMVTGARKVPSPLPFKNASVPAPLMLARVTAKSALPSPSKSALTIAAGKHAGRNNRRRTEAAGRA